ncbi:putative glutamyl-tRNA synthetase, cytoplasmic [Rozella allomycis CSF55]|uniref:Probable glutamate--tRNA ligase, cytoplasmic n=1 Tax=Rozella allomycis (strain CSF55) TaxID=988480 RepID=A0A075B414_ROZAC|nr:Glutamyl-tRNA synthetase, class Ib domain-containing protein [Rozella allomycis CSF55]RKP20096.1 putative glutamyl-tRNA synthetase, cytoplasmic [Rozella allomycis CSF55]|eukprot:EPZ35939.1 Glutamyl-tRNA synthetase, class Ib domain-containing protein [Rozella allomycis CSF55]
MLNRLKDSSLESLVGGIPVRYTNLEAAKIKDWLVYAIKLSETKEFKDFHGMLVDLDRHLKFYSFVALEEISLPDIIIFGVIKGCGKKFDRGQFDNISRWYDWMAECKATKDAAELLKKSSNGKAKDQGKFDIDLAGAEFGKVVTRFPPEPSGYLHIGHAKAALLNEYFAHRYGGELIVRFDDTNPSKEKCEFEESILEDLTLLGVKHDRFSHTSDYFEDMIKFAEQLIKQGDAYVDDTVQEKMREERMNGVASKCRDLSVEENLRVFEEMKKASEEGMKYCLRAKMSVDAKNKALRDPVIYRINLQPHHRTGSKWKVYPTYDFACPIVDSVEGVTHALRTNEYHDRNDQYYWFIEKLGLRKPFIWDYSRINFEFTLLSKRKLTWFVNEKHVEGWHDPRFPTVRGIRRRGMTIEALKEYILMQGASKNTLLLKWDKIWAINKQKIDPIAPRHTAIENDSVVARIRGNVMNYSKEVLKHKKNPELGFKTTEFSNEILIDKVDVETFELNEEITLMDWGNAFVRNLSPLELELHLEGDFKKTKKKVTWLSKSKNLIPVELKDFDFLVSKPKLEEEDSFEDCLVKETEFTTLGLADANVKDLKKGDIIQLERRGFFIVDKPFDGNSVCFILIPDGKPQSTMPRGYVEPKKPEVKKKQEGKKDSKKQEGNKESKEAPNKNSNKESKESNNKNSNKESNSKKEVKKEEEQVKSGMYQLSPFIKESDYSFNMDELKKVVYDLKPLH